MSRLQTKDDEDGNDIYDVGEFICMQVILNLLKAYPTRESLACVLRTMNATSRAARNVRWN